ncbi:hypothetical protein [Olsenella sp. Marseille-P4559]|uniref:hypothetical protein n=1 Tax=Olsenella sp. Marseille-P4559 TaxID=2364795 RepID=UPI00103071BB|nr:hypothetical protein [Olsenella sp. Marseille-P4559]
MTKTSELVWYRVARVACLVVAAAVDAAIVVLSPSAGLGPSLAVLAATALALLAPTLVQLRVVASAERLLDERCDPASLARRGDAMGLSAPIPRSGLYRAEAVLPHRYGIALADVGRPRDAAVVRRRIEDGLGMRRRPARSMDCAVMAMLLADLCARLGDAGAVRAYAAQFLEGLAHVPQSARGRVDESLEAVGGVTVRSSAALYFSLSARDDALASFGEADVARLEGTGVGRRLAAEARMALAKAAAAQGERDRERMLLGQVAAAAPRMRVGKLAARILGSFEGGSVETDGSGYALGYGSLCLDAAVDAHAAVMKDYGGARSARP